MSRGLQHLGNEHVEGTHTIDFAGIHVFRHVFTDFRQRAKSSFRLVHVGRFNRLRQQRKAVDPLGRLDDLHQDSDNLRRYIA